MLTKTNSIFDRPIYNESSGCFIIFSNHNNPIETRNFTIHIILTFFGFKISSFNVVVIIDNDFSTL